MFEPPHRRFISEVGSFMTLQGASETRQSGFSPPLEEGPQSGGMVILDSHSERSEKYSPVNLQLVVFFQTKLRMTIDKNIKTQIATQKRLAMTTFLL